MVEDDRGNLGFRPDLDRVEQTLKVALEVLLWESFNLASLLNDL